jgi:hypothetical protein
MGGGRGGAKATSNTNQHARRGLYTKYVVVWFMYGSYVPCELVTAVGYVVGDTKPVNASNG